MSKDTDDKYDIPDGRVGGVGGTSMSTKVWVYRNLKYGRNSAPLYSVVCNGKVVRRVHRILLTDCRFVVREGGRQMVLQQKTKNVHAFVVGYDAGTAGAYGIDKNGKDLPVRVIYNPYNDANFMAIGGPTARAISGAGVVLLNQNGISAAYVSDLSDLVCISTGTRKVKG
jgi:hypothetical protein